MQQKYILSGSLFIMIGVILGAFGAHALKESLGTHGQDIWKTAVLYQFVHGLACIALSGSVSKISTRSARIILLFFCLGIVLFSGSLYVLAISSSASIRSIVGPLTPIGGLLFILGWATLIWSLLRSA